MPKRPVPEQCGPAPKRQKQHGQNAGDAFLHARKMLPVWKHKKQIQEQLRKTNALLIAGATGSGKSTQVPQFLFQEEWCQRKTVKLEGRLVGIGGMIAITQPRRVAATTLAHRVAQEAGTPLRQSVKGLVGYSVRFDHYLPRGAKIKFLTEGMLLQEMIRDPHLRQYSAIVVDEIHERSLDVDLLSGFLRQILHGDKRGRGGIPLKVIIMSATADVEGIQDFFGDRGDGTKLSVEVVNVEGRQHPVEVTYSLQRVPRDQVKEAITKRVFQINQSEPLPGDILAFMTGQEEIEACQKLIEGCAMTLPKDVPSVRVFPLYGQLSIEAQAEAFGPVKEKMTRKVVLATNIAETSVTVPGVRYVIDCGDAKVKLFEPAMNVESLRAVPISKSSVIQRTGRAGREAPGKCYRLYTREEHGKFMDITLPEIIRIDVIGAILTMKVHGINDIYSFPLMDPPDPLSTEKALLQLHFMRALSDTTGEITDIGRKMALFPVTAPVSRVLLAAADPENHCLLEAIDIISCLTGGETVFSQVRLEEEAEDVEELRKELFRREGDLLTYLTTMQAYAAENTDRVGWCRARRINLRTMHQALKIRKQLRHLCKDMCMLDDIPRDPQPFAPATPHRAEVLLKCFLTGFAFKTALLAPDKSYVTVQGRHHVAIHPSSVLRGEKKEAIMYMEHIVTTKSYVKKVSAIHAQWALDALENRGGFSLRAEQA